MCYFSMTFKNGIITTSVLIVIFAGCVKTEYDRETIIKFVNECAEELKFDKAAQEAFYKRDFSQEQTKCMHKCLGEKFKVISGNEFDEGGFVTAVETDNFGEMSREFKTKSLEAYKKCIKDFEGVKFEKCEIGEASWNCFRVSVLKFLLQKIKQTK